jgi:Mrp family chromosome partitioning ATPase
MGLALFIGVVCGLGLAVVQEYVVDHTIRKPGDLPSIFQAPVLMSMPKIKVGRTALGPGGGRVPLLLAAHNGESPVAGGETAEARAELRDLYDALRDRLMTLVGSDPSKMPYILGVTGCAKGSGVSTIAAGLALALARNGNERVVLLDANTETAAPTIFGVNPATGVVEMIPDGEGNTTVAQHSLFVVPSGDAEPKTTYTNPAHRYAALIQQLRGSKVRFVVIDMPPVKATSLTLRIARLLDGILLVVASEKVSRHVAEHARDLLTQSDAKVIGTILNKRRQYVPDWLYPTC